MDNREQIERKNAIDWVIIFFMVLLVVNLFMDIKFYDETRETLRMINNKIGGCYEPYRK